jgi:hypothetical protein
VASGDEVTFCATGQVPDAAGAIVTVEWDFDGAGLFHVADPVDVADKVSVERRYRFGETGTYFPTVRMAAHREGDRTSPYARVQNLARVRVVVSEPERARTPSE